jgi:hypothetical protein
LVTVEAGQAEVGMLEGAGEGCGVVELLLYHLRYKKEAK